MTLSKPEADFKSMGIMMAGASGSVQLSRSLQDASTRLQKLILEPPSLICHVAECLIPMASEFQPRLGDGQTQSSNTTINWESEDSDTNAKVCQLSLVLNSRF